MKSIALAVLLVAGVASAQPAGSGSGAGSGSATIIQIPLDADAPEVSAAASPTELKLGSRFTLFVTAVFGSGVIVNLREPLDLGPAFEVKRRASTDTTRADGRTQREWQIEVFAWDLGDLQVPPVAVTFTASGRAGQVETNAVPIHVTGVLGDADDPKLLRGYAPPIELVEHSWLWYLLHDPIWLGIGVGGLVATFLIVRRLRRPHRVTPLVGGFAARTPRRRIDMTSERALERLREIEQGGALDRDDTRKLGYADMADVVREYVGARFAIPTARELTSSELLAKLEQSAAERDHELARTWLERCDLVKYGGFHATTAEAHAVLEGARELIISTSTARKAAA